VTARFRNQEGPRLPGAFLHLALVAFSLAWAAPQAGADGPSAVPEASRFSHTFDSPEALARRFLDLLAGGDPQKAAPLALSEQEFKEIVWPEMPAAQPERNIPADFAWDNMWPKSRYGLQRTFDRHGGRSFELVKVVFGGETTKYRTFTVSRQAHCVVRDGSGQEQTLDLFGSVLVDGDRYKLFSFVVD
jgi:hypothetical protein